MYPVVLSHLDGMKYNKAHYKVFLDICMLTTEMFIAALLQGVFNGPFLAEATHPGTTGRLLKPLRQYVDVLDVSCSTCSSSSFQDREGPVKAGTSADNYAPSQ